VGRWPSISSREKIELTGEVTRFDDDTMTVGGKDLGITVKTSRSGGDEPRPAETGDEEKARCQ